MHLRGSETGITRSGMKEFQNNRNYKYKEKWEEDKQGDIKVEKETDDGCGTKKNERYTGRQDEVVQEEVIEKVSQNQKIIINKISKG